MISSGAGRARIEVVEAVEEWLERLPAVERLVPELPDVAGGKLRPRDPVDHRVGDVGRLRPRALHRHDTAGESAVDPERQPEVVHPMLMPLAVRGVVGIEAAPMKPVACLVVVLEDGAPSQPSSDGIGAAPLAPGAHLPPSQPEVKLPVARRAAGSAEERRRRAGHRVESRAGLGLLTGVGRKRGWDIPLTGAHHRERGAPEYQVVP